MYRAGFLCVYFFTLVAASLRYDKIITGAEGYKQAKVLDLFTGLGGDDFQQEYHQPQPFSFTDPHLYTDKEVLPDFINYYEEGFLKKDDYFTNSIKTSRDTSTIADLFYFARDFETFYKIADWAKKELNPVQYTYAVYTAVLHRSDTTSVVLPPIYETLPNFFVPSKVINAAYSARLNGVSSRKFQVNNTGWDWSWHNKWGMTSPLVIHQGNMQFYDVESRLSYYREDVTRSDFFFKYFLKMNARINNESKYRKKLERLGEWYYTAFKWILTRYNVERYAVDLPPVQSINLDFPIREGYDPEMVDLFGHHIPGRPDNIAPRSTSPKATEKMDSIIHRILENVDGKIVQQENDYEYNDILSEKYVENILTTVYIGNASDWRSSNSLYMNFLGLVDTLASFQNTNELLKSGVLLNEMTRMRDPVYYRILAYIDRIVRSLESQSKPYSVEQLGFPGVKITGIDITKLETYFELFDFDITNCVPGLVKQVEYSASQFRINHKPFSVVLRVNSDQACDAVVKIFIGPASDSRNQSLSLNQQRESFTLMDTFTVKLNEGETVVERKPGQSELTADALRFKEIKQRINDETIQGDQFQCFYPSNLLLPKGSISGTPFKFYFIIYPLSESVDKLTDNISKSCGRDHLTIDASRTLTFPVDRQWISSAVHQDNQKFVDAFIYHVE